MAHKKNKKSSSEFNTDLEKEGYHVFAKNKSKIRGFYPNDVPCDYEEIDIIDLKKGDCVTIRVFFLISKVPVFRVDGGYVDLDIESIENDTIYGNILTEMPVHFPMAKGTTIELSIEEILQIIK